MNKPALELEGVSGHGFLDVCNVYYVRTLAPQFTPCPLVTTKLSSLQNYIYNPTNDIPRSNLELSLLFVCLMLPPWIIDTIIIWWNVRKIFLSVPISITALPKLLDHPILVAINLCHIFHLHKKGKRNYCHEYSYQQIRCLGGISNFEDGPADGPPSGPMYESALSGSHIVPLSMLISSHGACTSQVYSISLFHTDCCVFDNMS